MRPGHSAAPDVCPAPCPIFFPVRPGVWPGARLSVADGSFAVLCARERAQRLRRPSVRRTWPGPVAGDGSTCACCAVWPPQGRVSPGKGTTAARARRAVPSTLCPDLRRSLPRVLLLRSRHAGTTGNMHSLLAARRRVPAVSLRILPSPLPAHRPTAQEGTFLAYIQKAVNVVHGFQGSDTRQQLLPLLPFGPDGVGSAAAARPFVTLAGKRCCVKIMPPIARRSQTGQCPAQHTTAGHAAAAHASAAPDGIRGRKALHGADVAAARGNNSQRNYF